MGRRDERYEGPDNRIGKEGFEQVDENHVKCPCGHTIEIDEGFPCQHRNPMKDMLG